MNKTLIDILNISISLFLTTRLKNINNLTIKTLNSNKKKRIAFDKLNNIISIVSEKPKYPIKTIFTANKYFQILVNVVGQIHCEIYGKVCNK